MKSGFHRFLSNTCGATAVEYGLIAMLISAALITGAMSLGNAINGTLDTAAQHLKNSQ